MPTRRAAAAGVALVAALLLSAAPAAAAWRWSGPVALTRGDVEAVEPQAAINAQGIAVAAWYQIAADGRLSTWAATTRGRRGEFRPAVLLGTAREPGGGAVPSLPAVAIDRRGNALVAWLQGSAIRPRVVVASGRNGKFDEPIALSPPKQPSVGPQLAVDRDGRAIAAWSTDTGDVTRIQAAFRRPNATEFGPARTLSGRRANAFAPQVGTSRAGDAVVAWLSASVESGATTAIAARSGTRGRFGRGQRISPSGLDADNVRVAVSARGKAIATWTQSSAAESNIGTAYAPRDRPFRDPRTIRPDDPRRVTGLASVAITRSGRATIAWIESPPPPQGGRASVRTAQTDRSGHYRGAQVLDEADAFLGGTDVAVAAGAGNAVTAWDDSDVSSSSVQAALRLPGERSFGEVETLSPDVVSGSTPSVTATRRLAIVVWQGSTDAGDPTFVSVARRR